MVTLHYQEFTQHKFTVETNGVLQVEPAAQFQVPPSLLCPTWVLVALDQPSTLSAPIRTHSVSELLLSKSYKHNHLLWHVNGKLEFPFSLCLIRYFQSYHFGWNTVSWLPTLKVTSWSFQDTGATWCFHEHGSTWVHILTRQTSFQSSSVRIKLPKTRVRGRAKIHTAPDPVSLSLSAAHLSSHTSPWIKK